jgi:hypothetical protein
MTTVLDESNRSRAFTTVGSSSGIAENLWAEWRPDAHTRSGVPVDPIVTTLVAEYLDGVRDSVSRILDRDLRVVSGADALAGFWALHALDREKPSALASLARIVFNIASESQMGAHSPNVKVVELEASRLRFPDLKSSWDARATRTLSRRGDIDAQLAKAAEQLPPGCQLVVADDRLQSGGTLSAVHAAALRNNLSPHAIIVAHSEMPRSDAHKLLPGVTLYAHLYDYSSEEDRTDWLVREQRGEVRLPLSEELHDIVSVSPASGEAIVNRYMDALPEIKVIYAHLKAAFIVLAENGAVASSNTRRDAGDVIGLENLQQLGVTIRNQDAFLNYFAHRAAEYARARSDFSSVSESQGELFRKLQRRELNARWGANDIDRLFSHSSGSLALREHPEFDTDRADKRRFGAFFPFPLRGSLTITKELKAQGSLAWAQYSYDEIARSIQLVDQWQQRFGALNPLSIPHLCAPSVRQFMQRHEVKGGVVDQLDALRRLLGRQIHQKDIRPLI